MRLLLRFFLSTYLISWTCFIAAAMLSLKTQSGFNGMAAIQQTFLLLGTIAPSLTALWLTYREDIPGKTGMMLYRIGQWRVHFGWYLFAVFYFAVIKLSVALIDRLVTGTWPQFGREAWYIMGIAIFFSTWVQAGEEIGWRGFALPRLTAKFGLSISTLLLGVLWATWHLPLFFMQGADKFGQSFFLYLMQMVALSVAIGYLFWRTNGSLLLTMLMHASINNTKDIVPSMVAGASNPFGLSHSLVAWLTVMVLWISAFYFLVQMRSVKLPEKYPLE